MAWACAHLAAMLLLLAAVGFGGGGLAVGASVVSRRGRDAQLTVYILMVLLMMSPLLGWLGLPPEAVDVLEWFNPYFSMNRLVWAGRCIERTATAGCWAGLGLAGIGPGGLAAAPELPIGGRDAGENRVGAARRRPSASGRCSGKSSSSSGSPAWADSAAGWAFCSRSSIGGGSLVLAGMMAYATFFAPDSDLAALGFRHAHGRPRRIRGNAAGLAAPVGHRPASGGLDRLGARARHLGRPADEPARAERNLASPSSSAASTRCDTWPPPCCWPGRWRLGQAP